MLYFRAGICTAAHDTDYTFKAYFSNVGDELLRKKGAKNYWKGLTVNFIAKEPART